MSSIEIIPVLGSSVELSLIWELYRKNSNTLGFLPRGAFEEFAHAGRVLAAIKQDTIIGYVAWRRSNDEAVLVHLCVSEEHRGSLCATHLLNALIEQCKNDAAIRLRCRKDYEAANRLWPRFAFAVEGEALGRGVDQAVLLVWRRVNRDPPLLEYIERTTSRPESIIAIDANVFFDLIAPESIHYQESAGLLADWLDDVDVCITRELRNEISRQNNDKTRKSARIGQNQFRELAGHPDQLKEALAKICAVLPQAARDSDDSDRRQIAHAYLGGANFFATRDQVLLDHAEDLRAVTGLFVARPSDVISKLHTTLPKEDYAPIRLRGIVIEERAPTEEELLPFQRFTIRESKAKWLATIRSVRAAPDRYTVKVIGIQNESPRIALAIEKAGFAYFRICFLRALSGPITATLLRRVLADLIESAFNEGVNGLLIEDPGPGEVREALIHVGFEVHREGLLARYMLPKVVSRTDVEFVVVEHFPDAMPACSSSPTELESRFWPLKILGADILSFIVPIKPAWAAVLFDRDLAGQELFGVPVDPALALENVYYSASNVTIPPGSRVLWYVSGAVGAVRAVSTCLGTDSDTATQLSRKYHRLGAYEWSDVLGAAKGNPRSRLHGYLFAQTELLSSPVQWGSLEKLIFEHMGTKNRIPSPLRVPEALFEDVYRMGMARSS